MVLKGVEAKNVVVRGSGLAAKIIRKKVPYVLGAMSLLIGVKSVYAAEFPSTAQTTGNLISHVAPEMGRLAIIEILGDYVITIPEVPSSPAGSDYLVRAWDISDPANPVEVQQFGVTSHPFSAHGAIKHGNELYIGGYPNNAIRYDPETDTLEHTRWSGPDGHWNKGGLMRPWAARQWWSYGEIEGLAWLQLDGVQTAEWDHLGLTGVIGFPTFMGNLLVYASDQSKSGIASYDISNPSEPQLLDVLNQPAVHPYIVDNAWNNTPAEWGIGGYWAEISHSYMVFARRGTNAGIQVVDFDDPNNLSMHCEFLAKDPKWPIDEEAVRIGDYGNPMYVGFQDEYVFSERYKLNLETCELVLQLDELGNGVETSQYSRPIGNLLLTGGISNWRLPDTNPAGLGIWAHQSEPDTRAPYVSYHIPKANQTNYPLMAPISLMIPETLRSETIIPGETITLRTDSGDEVEIDYILSHTGMLTVDPIEYLAANTTYELIVSGIEDAVHNAMEPYTFRFSTGNSVVSPTPSPTPSPSPSPIPAPNNNPVINSVSATPNEGILVHDNVVFAVNASDADDDTLEYRWRVQGFTEYSDWSNSDTFNYVFESSGSFSVSVQVRDDEAAQATSIRNINVSNIADNGSPAIHSSAIVYDAEREKIWTVNPDNDTLTRIDAGTREVDFEVATADDPRSLAIDANGQVWVSAFGADLVQVFSSSGEYVADIETNYGSAPFGIIVDSDSANVYVSLYSSGELLRINTDTLTINARVPLGHSARAIAMDAAETRLLVTRFISGDHYAELWDVNLNDFTLSNTIKLQHHLVNDGLDDGRGLPNYLSAVVINSTGDRAYVVAKKDNINRGLLNGNEDLDDDNTLRTIAMTIDLDSSTELRSARIDFDNADSPSALALSGNGQFLFVAMQGRNQVFTLDVDTNTGVLGGIAAQFAVQSAPQGLAFNADYEELYAKNFLSRSVSVLSLEDFLAGGSPSPEIVSVNTVEDEALSASVLRGKQLFYHAAEGVQSNESPVGLISAEGYISCASCHFDGGHDGRTWDFTGRGEGLRNNISLRGRGGVRFGPVHWSANFDEIQDFENDIRNAFLGRGLMSDEDFAVSSNPLGVSKAGRSEALDDLATYVSSLNKSSLLRSPARNIDGSMTAEAILGQTIFNELECASCHRGEAFTDGDVHNVGSIRSYSGQTRGEVLSEIKTPSLLGLFDSKPYLHDGSAAELRDVFSLSGGLVFQAENLDRNAGAVLIEQTGFSYLRSGAGVQLNNGAQASLTVESESAGKGVIRLRAGANISATEISVSLNGQSQSVELIAHELVDDVAVAFSEYTVPVDFLAGNNSIVIESEQSVAVIVDDVTISLPEHVVAASVHTQVAELDLADQNRLISFLRQLDQESAPDDGATIVLGPIAEEPTPQDPEIPEEQAEAPEEPAEEVIEVPEEVQVEAPEEEIQAEEGTPSLIPGGESSGGGGSVSIWVLLALMVLARSRATCKIE